MYRIARFWLPLALCCVFLVGLPLSAQAASWPKGSRILVYLNVGGMTTIPKAQVEDAFKKAFAAWNSIKCADIGFAYQGTTNAGFSVGDKRSVISFQTPNGGGIYFSSSQLNAKGEITEMDFQVHPNPPNMTWSLNPTGGNQLDLESVAMSIAGRMLGLPASTNKDATLYSSFQTNDIGKRSLHPDDITAACNAYNNGQPQCATDADCALFSMGCQNNVCVAKAPQPSAKYCKPCTSNTDCGADHICLFLGSNQYCLQLANPDGLCPSGQVARGNQCWPPNDTCPKQGCTSNADCIAGHTCKNGTCTPQCTSDTDCSSNQRCVAGKCEAVASCTAGQKRPCTCSDGKNGEETCKSDGSGYDACQCSGNNNNVCTAGATQACTCSDGKSGSQTCNSDGKAWGACTCSGNNNNNVCAPGGTQACTCSDGKSGSQTCNSDGKAWGTCQCSGNTQVCTPGGTQACQCSGDSGSQTCNADGKGWGACQCSGNNNNNNTNVCTPGGTQACVCTDGKNGSQTCNSDGKAWGACTCTGGNNNNNNNTQVCAPGGTQACVCPDGKNGSQTCNADGQAWGACTCAGGNNNNNNNNNNTGACTTAADCGSGQNCVNGVCEAPPANTPGTCSCSPLPVNSPLNPVLFLALFSLWLLLVLRRSRR